MIAPGTLERLAEEARQLVLEMSSKLAAYDAKTTALLLSTIQVQTGDSVTFPEHYAPKKGTPDAAARKIEEFMHAVNHPEKYPLETRVADAAAMQAILTEYQGKLAALYAPIIDQP